MYRSLIFSGVLLFAGGFAAADGPETDVKPTELITVYADGRHNMNVAFTKWQDKYWLAFRTGTNHGSPDGAIIVLNSADGTTWEKVHFIDTPDDDRDVMFIATPEKLMLYVPHISRPPGKVIWAQETVTTTTDGKTWSEPQLMLEPPWVLWRPIEHKGRFWATAYRPGRHGTRALDLIRSDDGLKWERITTMRQGHSETETTLVFVADEKLLAFHRDAKSVAHGFLMTSQPPYTEWTDPVPVPTMLNGQSAYTFNGVHYLLTRTIRYEGDKQFLGTMIYSVDHDGAITPYCKLRASGDSAYPNALQVGDEMWVAYHSSHEGTANIYLAKVPLKKQSTR